MKKVKIKFPQVYWEEKELTIRDEDFDRVMDGEDCNDAGRGSFIWNNLTENEQDKVPYGEKGIISAVDVGYAWVKEVKQENTFGGVHLSFAKSKMKCPHCEREITFQEIEDKGFPEKFKCKCKRKIGIVQDIKGNFHSYNLDDNKFSS